TTYVVYAEDIRPDELVAILARLGREGAGTKAGGVIRGALINPLSDDDRRHLSGLLGVPAKQLLPMPKFIPSEELLKDKGGRPPRGAGRAGFGDGVPRPGRQRGRLQGDPELPPRPPRSTPGHPPGLSGAARGQRLTAGGGVGKNPSSRLPPPSLSLLPAHR